MIGVLVVGAASAQVPEGLRPALAPADVHVRWASAHPDDPPLACEAVLAGRAALCFRVWEGKRRRFVTQADLVAWGVGVGDLVDGVRRRSEEHVGSLVSAEVIDMPASYWIARDDDGWAIASLLHPERMSAIVGGADPRVAVPRSGVLLAWRSGSDELDKVMAVAARELWDAGDDAVTPMIFTWSAKGFAPWGQATPAGR